MKALHIAPGYSAGGSLKAAIHGAGRDDAVLKWPDDLSCGPIDPDDPALRTAWWDYGEDWDLAAELRAFWERVAGAEERLVVWFSRHAAGELAFFLAWADRMGDRPYDIVDVTGFTYPITQEGSSVMSLPTPAVFYLWPDTLRSLLDSGRPITAPESAAASQRWRELKSENAPFRIVTEAGLASAPLDHFDQLLLDQAGADWRKVLRVVGGAMARSGETCRQVGDTMLLRRLVALIEAGKLVADGDPWEMRVCRVRLR
jgi:hypothetical protein